MKGFDVWWSQLKEPKQLGGALGLLGAFVLGRVGADLAWGQRVLATAGTAWNLFLAGLLLGSGIYLWLARPTGWWLAWGAMLCNAYGTLTNPVSMTAPGWLGDCWPGLMVAVSGGAFGGLANPAVYGPCFASTALPHAVFGAAPALLLIAGSLMVLAQGGAGVVIGPGLLLVTMGRLRWLYGPLVALIRGERRWHRRAA